MTNQQAGNHPSILRIAAVQMNFQPSARYSDMWRIEEPLLPCDPFAEFKDDDFLLARLKDQDPLLHSTANALTSVSRRDYLANLEEMLKEILTYCIKNEVDVVVFPEYSIPPQLISILNDYSPRIVIVAGIGFLRGSDLLELTKYNFDVNGLSVGNNAAIFLYRQYKYVITKKFCSDGETIESGSGPQCYEIQTPKGTVKIAVAICLDFLNEGPLFRDFDPNLVVIPSLSKNTSEFVKQTPRGYARIFANHAAYGGTYIGMSSLKGMGFTDKNGMIPLPQGTEGIVIVDWDYKHFTKVPKDLRTADHRLYARSNFIYKGLYLRQATTIESIRDVFGESELTDPENIQKLTQLANYALNDNLSEDQKIILLQENLTRLLENIDNFIGWELLALSRHCVFSASILTVEEWRYLSCKKITESLRDLLEQIPAKTYTALGVYESTLRSVASFVRTSYLDPRHRGYIPKSTETTSPRQLLLLASLGSYASENAINTLPKQLTVLRVLAETRDPHLLLRYRIHTFREDTGIMRARFDVICTVQDKSEEALEDLKEGLGQLIVTAFSGAYSLSYTHDDYPSYLSDVIEQASNVAEIRRSRDRSGTLIDFKGNTDWGLIVDLLRSLDVETTLELHCSPFDTQRASESNSDTNEDKNHVLMTLLSGAKTAEDLIANLPQAKMLLEMQSNEGEIRRLGMRILIGSEKPLPSKIVEAIGVEIAGKSPFEVFNNHGVKDITIAKLLQENDKVSTNLKELFSFTPTQALRVFHPPFGHLYASSGEGEQPPLDIPTTEVRYPSTGIKLGFSKVRRVRSDQRTDIRLAELDRLRHTYIIGKTGTGKTNLLKNMVAQDVNISGRGVTVIDPHGDLVDYVVREIPAKRLSEVVLIDLARTETLPILNPLSLERNDKTTVGRTIQELLTLLRSKMYHEYTGPRFDEFTRLAFNTFLDSGYPEPASLIELPRIFMNTEFQDAARSMIKDAEIKERWDFEDRLRQSHEYGDTIHWVTSKFDELVRTRALRCVLGGAKATIDVADIVARGGILLVRIPEAIIGKQAADFIGSLILLQLRMAIIRRREIGGNLPFHFVYVDEFQNFANTDFHTIVAEARKFKIGFTLAHQNLEQLREFRIYTGSYEDRLLASLLGNVGNLISFGIGVQDSKALSPSFGVPQEKMMWLDRHTALARLSVNEKERPTFTLHTEEAVRHDPPLPLEDVEERMLREGYWVNTEETLRDIEARVDRVISKSKQATIDLRSAGTILNSVSKKSTAVSLDSFQKVFSEGKKGEQVGDEDSEQEEHDENIEDQDEDI